MKAETTDLLWPLAATAAPALADIAFALLAPVGTPQGPEEEWLLERETRVAAALRADGAQGVAPGAAPGTDAAAWLARWRAVPPPVDRRLAAIGAALALADVELLAVALAAAGEVDMMAARVLAWLQAPVGGARPTVGLAARLAELTGETAGVAALATGRARAVGLLRIVDETRSLPEAALAVPQPLVFALAEPPRFDWPGLREAGRAGRAARFPLPTSLSQAAAGHARALLGRSGAAARGPTPDVETAAAARVDAAALAAAVDAAGDEDELDRTGPALVIRAGHPREAEAAAAAVARAVGRRAFCIDGEPPLGVGPWLELAGAWPVLCIELVPGERKRIAPIAGWRGPVLIVAGPDGSLEFDGETVPSWRVPTPPAAERAALWAAALGAAPPAAGLPGRHDAAADEAAAPADAVTRLAERLGHQHRHAAGRIAELGRAARYQAELDGAPAIAAEHVARAARGGSAGDVGALAELMPDEIGDEALVLPPLLREELQAIAARCLSRDEAARGLGPAIQARFRPGVRALFVGPSGTGKSLAVGWLATRLGLPLYRVDLASVSSKYIGETEKNLAQLFARAEHAEVVLMFDEADSLFGKRTDVKDSNDRFANAQTNYLLTRIESYEGIAILTSNSRARFDSAFTRRLDAIVEFPAPPPQERRALWVSHLGAASMLGAAELNRLAVHCDLAGGHIRNIVLAAAAAARGAGRPLVYDDLVRGVASECRKLGRHVPAGL